MAQVIHNLDTGASEYFEFTVTGHAYRFRHLTGFEIESFRELREKYGSADEKEKRDAETELNDLMFSFITPVDGAPDFKELWKEMKTPWRNNFNAMIDLEFSRVSNNNLVKK